MNDKTFAFLYNKICDKQDGLKYAINVDTGFYILPVDACKSFNMNCPACSVKAILSHSAKGDKYLKHYLNELNCDYYNNRWNKIILSSSSQDKINETKKLIHNKAIKMMVDYLNSGKKIIVDRICKWSYENVKTCDSLYPYEIKLEDGDYAVEEKRINETLKRADIAILNNEDNIKQIIEIYCTNKTPEGNRPDDIPWCELDAFKVLNNIIDGYNNYTCQRLWCCDDCGLENIRRQEESDAKIRREKEIRERQHQERLARIQQELQQDQERRQRVAQSEQEHRQRLEQAERERKERLARAEQERLERLKKAEQEEQQRLARAEQERLEWEAAAPERERKRLELIALEEQKNKQKLIEKEIDDKNHEIWDIEDKIKNIKIFINSLDKKEHAGIINNMQETLNEYKQQIKELNDIINNMLATLNEYKQEIKELNDI
jgi:hypothetical protein